MICMEALTLYICPILLSICIFNIDENIILHLADLRRIMYNDSAYMYIVDHFSSKREVFHEQ